MQVSLIMTLIDIITATGKILETKRVTGLVCQFESGIQLVFT